MSEPVGTPGPDVDEPAADSIEERLTRARQSVQADPADALRLLNTILADPTAAPSDKSHASQVYARALRIQGRHEEALSRFADAARFADEAADALLAAQVRIGEVDALAMLGRHTDALALATSLESTLRANGAPLDAARVLGNRGSYHLRRDEYAEALACYDAALGLVTADADPMLFAGLHVNRAIACTYLGRFTEARDGYDQAAAIYQAQGRPFDAAVALTNIGFLHTTASRYAVALERLQAAYNAFTAQGRDHEAARCAIDIGDTYRALNLWQEAAESYQAAITVFDRLPLEYDRALAESGLALVALGQGRLEDALAALERAEAVYGAQGNAVGLARTHLYRAAVRLRQGDNDAAEAEAAEAEAAFTERGLDAWAAEATLIRAEAEATPDAETLARLNAAAETGRRNLQAPLESRAEWLLGRLYQQAGNRERAILHLRRSVAALESLRAQLAQEDLHIAFLADKESVYAELVALLLEGEPDTDAIREALEVVEQSRSRLLLERLFAALPAETVGEDEGAADPSWERLAELRAELGQTYRGALESAGGDARRFQTTASGSVLELEAEYARLMRSADLSRLLARDGLRGPDDATLRATPPTVEQIQEALGDQTLLSYCRIGENLGAFLVRRDGVQVFPCLSRWSDLRHAARRFRYHIQKMEWETSVRAVLEPTMMGEMDRVLARLYDLTLRPLEEYLPGERLVVIPAGALHGLPVHAFRGGCYAVDRWEIVYTPSASVWYTLTRRSHPTHRRSVPAGGTGYPGQWAGQGPTVGQETETPARSLVVGYSGGGALANVGPEVDTVSRLLPAPTVLRDEAATATAVMRHGEGCGTWHIATHAVFRDDNPLFSGLELADGWLLARDLYWQHIDAELVTLSACTTGRSRVDAGEELMGLSRGFLAAGARRIVASLWSVDDTATAEFMGRFYTLRQSHDTVGALRRAQQELRAVRPHPHFWAAFHLVGSR